MTALVESCLLCDGKGLLTARNPYQPDVPALLVWCPVCEGKGAYLMKEVTA